jgi:hypothetical protein
MGAISFEMPSNELTHAQDLRGTFGATSASGRLASSGVFGPMIGAWADWSGLPV